MAILSRRSLVFAARAIAAALLAGEGLAAQSGAIVENDIKAAFMYNFAKYVEWPDAAFPG